MYASAAELLDTEFLPHMKLLRCPKKGDITGVMTSHAVLQLYTHHVKRKTMGCAKPFCPDCDAMIARRYEAYIGLYSPRTRNHILLGFPVGATRQIMEGIGRTDRCRGLSLTLCRSSEKQGARVLVTVNHFIADMSAMPDAPDVMGQLERIWGLERKLELIRYKEEIEKLQPWELKERGEAIRRRDKQLGLEKFRGPGKNFQEVIDTPLEYRSEDLMGFERNDQL